MDASLSAPFPIASAIDADGGSEIAFFDVETTVPLRGSGQGYALLEFGAILVCPRRLVEVGSYSTLIRPSNPSAISSFSVRCNGITRDTIASASAFCEVADRVFHILHGRVWVGHNILKFDCVRIREAFAEIGRPAPEPIGTIDTLPLLTRRFGRRAGDMKMATLATYFGLGQQRHRSLDDVRLNLEVIKYCATVLFLESSLTDAASFKGLVDESTNTRNPTDGNASSEAKSANINSSSALKLNDEQKLSCLDILTRLQTDEEAASSTPAPNVDPSDLVPHIERVSIDQNASWKNGGSLPVTSCTIIPPSDNGNQHARFLDPDEVSTQCISTSLFSSDQSACRIRLLHKDSPIQLCCMGLKILFGISTKFVDHAGRPKLSFVVNVPASLSHLLDYCDHLAKRTSLEYGSSSVWRPVIRKNGYSNSSSIRLHIPTVANGDGTMYSTEIHQKEPSGSTQKLVFSRIDAAELDTLFVPGTIIDAYFSVDIYDFLQHAGIRLVAKRLVLHSR